MRTATFTVSLNLTHSNTVTINWATFDKAAIAGSDYSTGSGTLSFAPGEMSKTVSISVQAVSDRDIDFGVLLSHEVNCTLSTASTGVCTIKSDNALYAKVQDYYNKKSAYNTAYWTWVSDDGNRAIAQTNYNNAVTNRDNNQTNVNNCLTTANAAQASTDGLNGVVNARYTAWAASGFGAGLLLTAYQGAARDYNSAKATSDADWSAYNVAVSQRDAAQNSLNTATVNVNNWNAWTASAATDRDNKNAAMNTAKALAAAGFVGSTTLLA